MVSKAKYKVPRREERFAIKLPVRLKRGAQELELHTGDVSYRGMFICTDDPPVLRQLIHVELDLPPDGKRFQSHGMSVFVLPPNNNKERVPGVGIQFYAQSERDRRRWEDFVSQIRDINSPLAEDAVDPVRRSHPRIDARFEVRPRDVSELEAIFTKDVSAGGMFLETDKRLKVGRRLNVTIYHPIHPESFDIHCEVKRLGENPRGLGVAFCDMSEELAGQFQAFVEEGLEALADLSEYPVEVEE